MRKMHPVRLSESGQIRLWRLVISGQATPRGLSRAQTVLNADAGPSGRRGGPIAAAVGMSRSTVGRIRQWPATARLERALLRRARHRADRPPMDGEQDEQNARRLGSADETTATDPSLARSQAPSPDAASNLAAAKTTALLAAPAYGTPTVVAGAEPQAVGSPAEPPDVDVGAEEKSRRARWLQTLISASVVLAALACIVSILPGAWALIGTLVIGLSISLQRGASRSRLITSLLCLAVGVTTIDYLTWRLEVTNWINWWIATPLLVAEVFGALHTLGLQYTVWPRPQPQISPSEDPTRRPIFIFIPTVNEGPSVLTPTIQAALETRRRYLQAFPHGRVTIVLCNDGRVAGFDAWRDVEALAQRLGVVCVTRVIGGGAKAGNLEHARQRMRATGDALIVIFDADQKAKSDFLLKTAPPFADLTVGWVQTGQYYSNLDQPVARWANDQQALFYRVLCPGKAAHNAAFICGTNVVIRAAALDQIGGLPQDSVTEDFAASIELQPKWRSIFLTEVLATGLGPMDFPAYLKQQRRWAIGTIGVLRSHWRAIFLPQRGGLRLEQRVQYALACTHYFCGLRDLIYLASPLLFLMTGIPAVRGASLGLFLWHFLPYWIAAQAAFWYVGRRKTGLRGIIIGFGSFPVLIGALLTVLLGRRMGFAVTSKQRHSRRSWAHLTIYLVAVVCCVAGIGLAVTSQRARPESVAISLMWVIYDITLLGSVLWLGISDLRFDEAVARRSKGIGPWTFIWNPAAWRPAALSGFAALSGLLLISSNSASLDPVRFAASQERNPSPYLGLSLPYDVVKMRPSALEQELCLPFTIIGRTQDSRDSFDLSWAEQLAAHHQRPWITLQFGELDAHGVAPLDAALPAIANGVQDGAIRRWARDIYAYRKPVYLTILLHVDRNWSVSSAVANGGIPQDTPRAWKRVQDLFNAEGVTNVAWVWAPADPAHDQAYAPPESTIDFVLVSMIRYPDALWPDPAAVLSAVSARHQTKSLFLEVSATGDPAEKAAWLGRVAAVAKDFSQVYSLSYHDGSPDPHATAADNMQWSLESSALSLQAVRAWRSLVPSGAAPCQSSPPASPQRRVGAVPSQGATRSDRHAGGDSSFAGR
jgi:cellulose synthase/poly-beta-1,6-N-acetylglucosamine synthase-like glycosyltransferase